MKAYVGLSVIVMLLCFNVGMYIVDVSGLYDFEATDEAEDTAGELTDADGTFLSKIGVWSGLASILTLAGISGIIGTFANIDPLRAAGIGAFFGTILVSFSSSYRIINGFASSITGNNALATTIAGAVVGMFALVIVIFVIQLLTGGWRNIK
jgi:hypothetical protein